MTDNTISSTILSTRDLNREHYCWKDDANNGNDTVQQQYLEDDEDVCVEKIRERFDRDFLSKYGHLWRRMIREKNESTLVVAVDDVVVDEDDNVETKENNNTNQTHTRRRLRRQQ